MLRAMLGGFFPDIVLPDNREKIAKCVSSFLGSDHEVMFITGGMSMGKYDYVPGVLTELGGELKITKLAIRPGKPFVLAAMPGGKYVFGLPGNPVSAFVCTFVLASRLLRRMRGESPDVWCRAAGQHRTVPNRRIGHAHRLISPHRHSAGTGPQGTMPSWRKTPVRAIALDRS